MKELFGIPTGTLLVVLAIALAAALGAVAALAARHRVLLRLAVRNVSRRGSRTALIVVGLMLGTAIIAAALTTGDTMSHTIRSSAIETLGQTDELISARGSEADVGAELGAATGVRYFDERVVRRVDAALAGTGLTDGVTPAIIEPVALQAPARRQNEPRVTLFAADPARMAGFGTIARTDGESVALGDLRPGEALPQRARRRRAGRARPATASSSSPAAGARRPCASAPSCATTAEGRPSPGSCCRSRRPSACSACRAACGTCWSPTAATRPRAPRARTPWCAAWRRRWRRSGSRPTPSKQDAIDDADQAGTAFMAFFTTFGSFSIAAGILLIFLIFVMLAAERRGELGIARAIGTRRGHLVQLFLFEGAAYDLVAALVGAALGAVVAYAMVAVMAKAFGTTGLDVRFDVTAAQPADRLRDRRAADARRRRAVGLAREPDDGRDGDPQPPRAGLARASPAGRRARWAACSSEACWPSPVQRRRRPPRSCSASRSCSSASCRCCGWPACRNGSPTRAAAWRSSCC